VTLIELVVVLALVGAVVGLALPAIRAGTEGSGLRASAGRVAAVLREVRWRAINRRQPTQVAIDASRHAVTLTWQGEGEPVRRVEVPPPLRLDVVAGERTVTFSSRGLARDTRWIIENPQGRRFLIELHGITGRVAVSPVTS